MRLTGSVGRLPKQRLCSIKLGITEYVQTIECLVHASSQHANEIANIMDKMCALTGTINEKLCIFTT